MSEDKDLTLAAQAAEVAAENSVPALPAPRDLAPTPDTEPRLGLPSTDDDNVARARRRRDVVTLEMQQQALADTLKHLATMSRTPFRKVLAELIEAKPTPEAVRRFADKYPDRWAQAVSMMAGMSGFDRGVIEVNVFNVKGLSDSELMRELQMVRSKVANLAPKVANDIVDAEIIEEKP